MLELKAQMFFKQLISKVEYLHRKGVTHRDIKPENLLLMEDHKTLKISDFGLSTVFRHAGRERLLERRCGSLPYVAPEVLYGGQYSAKPGNVWSCGLVLVAFLAGELPWARPFSDQKEFTDWKEMNYSALPWSKIGNLPLSLLRKVIMPKPARRYTIGRIKDHIWTKNDFKSDESRVQGRGERWRFIAQETSVSLSQLLPDQGLSQGPVGDSAGWRGLGSSQPARLEALAAGGGRVRRILTATTTSRRQPHLQDRYRQGKQEGAAGLPAVPQGRDQVQGTSSGAGTTCPMCRHYIM
jgi:serine/threonine protein kinase